MRSRLLKTFLTVARTGNMTRAAGMLHLAQSSVSDQIQTLETDLGADLFTRTRGALELTQAGRALMPYAEEISGLSEEARVAVAAAANVAPGPITIGALETIASAKLPAWLASFRACHPDIDLRVRVAGSGELLRQLTAGEVDVAFCFETQRLDETLARRTISAEPLVLIAPPTAALTDRPSDLAALAANSFVATENGCAYRRLFETAFAEAGVAAPKIVAEVASIGAIVRLVAAGAGWALVPRLAVGGAIALGEVVEAPWPGPEPVAPLVMIWRRRRVQPLGLKQLLAEVGDDLAPVRPAGVRPRHAVSSLS